MPPWLPPTLESAVLWSLNFLALDVCINRRLAGFSPGTLQPAHTFLLWAATQIPAGLLPAGMLLLLLRKCR